MRRKIALVVGNNIYPEPYRSLEKAVEDASCVAGFLEHRLGFEVTPLYNKGASEIVDTFLNLTESAEDDLLFFFYFAGHGLVVGSSEGQSLLCTDASKLLLNGNQTAPGAISPSVLADISRQCRGDMFFCFDVCRTQTLNQKGGIETQRGGAGLRNATARPLDEDGRPARLVGRRLTLSSCADGQGAFDDGAFSSALVEELGRLYDGGYELKLDQRLVDVVAKRLQFGQTPVLSGTPFVLVPGKAFEPSSCATKPVVGSAGGAAAASSKHPSRSNAAGRVPTVQVGKIYKGVVNNVVEYGVFVDILPGRSGLCHKSQLSDSFVDDARNLYHVGDEIEVKVLEIDEQDRIKLSRRAALEGSSRIAGTAGSSWSPANYAKPANSAAGSAWANSASRRPGTRQELNINGTKYGFCWIPPEPFEIGTSSSKKSRDEAARPRRAPNPRGIWLLETPTSQALYESVTGTNPSRFRGAELPVENVSFNDALAFCKAIAKLLPSGMQAALPTEAQWERACRADTTTAYWYGDYPNKRMMNYKDSGVGRTSPVKRYSANPWGLYDAHGNVFEWTSDRYVESLVGFGAEKRAIRGGSWDSFVRRCRADYRSGHKPDTRADNLGFRFLIRCD